MKQIVPYLSYASICEHEYSLLVKRFIFRKERKKVTNQQVPAAVLELLPCPGHGVHVGQKMSVVVTVAPS